MTLRTESNLEEFVLSRNSITRIPKRQFTFKFKKCADNANYPWQN